MKKSRIVLLTFLALVLAVSCILAVACKKAEKFNVTWELDEKVTVTVTGYEYAKKMEFEKDTEVSFKVNAPVGYDIIVKIGGTTKTAKDGVYTFTVTKNTTVSVTLKEVLDHISVELAENNHKTYYAGHTIATNDIVVKAHYATSRVETVTGTVIYDNGEAFALGDTSVTVTYSTKSATLELGYSVKGLITLNLNGGVLSETELAKLPSNKNYDKENTVVTWTFDTPITTDIELPEPTLLLDKDDPTSGLPFEKWSGTGVVDNKIKPTNTSVVVGATYTTQLVNVTEMGFELEAGIPYLVIKGEFVAANSVYLYIHEGNEPPIKYDPNLTVTKSGSDNNFELKMDLAALVKATPEYAGEGQAPEDLDKSLIGPWLDIRFCVKLGNTTIQQELFLTDDSDFADLNDQVVAKVNEDFYRFFFESWTPQAGDFITGGGGAQFEGTEKILKLHIEKTAPYMIDGVGLEDEGGIAFLVVSGTYLDSATSSEELAKTLGDIYADLQNNDGANGAGWGMYLNNGNSIVKVISFNAEGNSTFKIYLNLAAAGDGAVVFSHFGGEGTNLVRTVEESSLTIGTVTYTMKNWTGWGSQLVCVFVVDTSAKSIKATGADIKVEDEKLLYIITGTYRNYTKEELEALVINFDLQTNDNIFGGGWDRNNDFTKVMSVNEAEHTFTITIDISSLITTKRAYTSHLQFSDDTIAEPGDFKPDTDSFDKTVEFNGFEVSMIYVKGSGSDQDFWGCVGIKVEEAGVAKYTVTSAELAEQEGKAVMIVKGTVKNYVAGSLVYVATVRNGGADGSEDYTNTVHTERVAIVVDEEGNFTATWDLSSSELTSGCQYWIHFGGDGVDLPANKVDTSKAEITVDGVKYSFVGVEPGKTNSPEIKVEALA